MEADPTSDGPGDVEEASSSPPPPLSRVTHVSADEFSPGRSSLPSSAPSHVMDVFAVEPSGTPSSLLPLPPPPLRVITACIAETEISADPSSQPTSPPKLGRSSVEATAGHSPRTSPIAMSLPRSSESEAVEKESGFYITVHLVDSLGEMEVYRVQTFQEHTIYHLKRLFEKIKGSNNYCVKNIKAVQHGILLSNTTWIMELSSYSPVSLLSNSDLPDSAPMYDSSNHIGMGSLRLPSVDVGDSEFACSSWNWNFEDYILDFGGFLDSDITKMGVHTTGQTSVPTSSEQISNQELLSPSGINFESSSLPQAHIADHSGSRGMRSVASLSSALPQLLCHVPSASPSEANSNHITQPVAIAAESSMAGMDHSRALIKVGVELKGPDGFEEYEIECQHDQTIDGLEDYIERIKGNTSYCKIRLAASQFGSTLPDTTWIRDIDHNSSVTIIATEESTYGLALEGLNESNFSITEFDFSSGDNQNHLLDDDQVLINTTSADPAPVSPAANGSDEDVANSPVNEEIEPATRSPASPLDSNAEPNVAPPPTNSSDVAVLSVVSERLLVPPSFSEQNLLHSNVHGFESSVQLRSHINDGPVRWISKKEAAALLLNAAPFAVQGIGEESKRDGLICVVDSTECDLPQTVKGYRVKGKESKENRFGRFDLKDVKMKRLEARGSYWYRRRITLCGENENNRYHVIQWKEHPTRKEAAVELPDAAVAGHTDHEEEPSACRNNAENAEEGGTINSTFATEVRTTLNKHSTMLQQLASHMGIAAQEATPVPSEETRAPVASLVSLMSSMQSSLDRQTSLLDSIVAKQDGEQSIIQDMFRRLETVEEAIGLRRP